MSLIKLGYDPNKQFNWKELPKDYSEKEYNGKLVVTFHTLLWEKVQNIMKIREKGWDCVIMIDGDRRSGKSTLAKSIAYLLDPNLSINNYVAGLEQAPDKIKKAKDGTALIFDEGSLVASSKDGMTKKNKQLIKIIDVVGVKKLTLIFCMPSFFRISKEISVDHSRFLIHVYTQRKLQRGHFVYYGTKKKKILYEIGKRNFNSYRTPSPDFNGKFVDFKLPFEEEYMKLKMESLEEAIEPDKKKEEEKPKPPTEREIRSKLMLKFKENNPKIKVTDIAKGFGMTSRSFYFHKDKKKSEKSEVGESIL